MPVSGLDSFAVVTIDEVDLPNRLVHVSDKTGGKFLVSFRNSPAGILYVPAQGENWVAIKVGVMWYLDTKLDDTGDHAWAVGNLNSGDVRIKGGNIFLEGTVHGADNIPGIDGLQGPQGTQGLTGSDGTPGIDGLSGPIGLTGSQGIDGLDGNTPTVLARISSTVAGLGTARDGAFGSVRCGTTPFEFVQLIYDATYGKWISPEFPLYSGNGAWNSTDGTTSELRQVFAGATTTEMATSYLRGKPMTDAGLLLQLRVVGQLLGTSSAGFTTQVFGRLNQANLGDAAYTLLTSAVVSSNIAGTTNNTFKMVDTGWASGPAATKDILVPTIAFDSGAAQTIRFVGALRGRWVA